MGACDFENFVKRRSKADGFDESERDGQKYLTQRYTDFANAQEAFDHAVDLARHDYGHGGYTGTIAEKHEFRVIGVCQDHDAARALIETSFADEDHICNDKWGPAACIEVTAYNPGWYFFGLASS